MNNKEIEFFEDLLTVYHSLKHLKLSDLNIEQNYTGIHLTSNSYNEDVFINLIEQFRNNQTLHIKFAFQLVNEAILYFSNYSNICSCNMNNDPTTKGCIIVGDLHGSFRDLFHIINTFGIPGKHYNFVFNGDFVDRGSMQCEVILTLIYAFLLNPTRVFLNRGNHEELNMNLSFYSNHPNFKQDCLIKYNDYGNELFNLMQKLFIHLPVATVVVNRIGFSCFVVHGGISDKIDLKCISDSKCLKRSDFGSVSVRIENDKSSEQFIDLLWSDPYFNPEFPITHNNARGIGVLFNADVSKEFCIKYGFNAIVRSHELRPEGKYLYFFVELIRTVNL